MADGTKAGVKGGDKTFSTKKTISIPGIEQFPLLRKRNYSDMPQSTGLTTFSNSVTESTKAITVGRMRSGKIRGRRRCAIPATIAA